MLKSELAVAVFMLVVAGFFTVNAVLAVILLKMVSPVKVSHGVDGDMIRYETEATEK